MARKMKDSGIEWIGEIPKEWVRCKIKNICSLIGSGTTPTSGNIVFYENGIINWIQSGDIYGKSIISEVSTLITEKSLLINNALKIYKAPFIVIAMYGASVGNTAISYIDACTNQACCCVKPKEDVKLKFLFYWINICKIDFLFRAEGSGQPNISQEKIKNQFFVFPPINEQQKIADFLDEKCVEIDSLSSDIQSQISILEDYEKSVIKEAVTKGLNPDVEMKDSGIEWIGEIPKHWIIIRAKNIVIIGNGSDPKKDGSIPVYGSGANSFKTCGEYKEAPAVLIGRKGATLHIPHYIEERYWNVDTAFDVKEKDNKVILKYYYYNAICFDYKKYISQTTLPSMTQTDYGNMYIPYPRKEEQKDIVKYLDTKCAEIDIAIIEKKKQLEVLERYKKSLIYEYVTGKREVSDNNG